MGNLGSGATVSGCGSPGAVVRGRDGRKPMAGSSSTPE
jgi:hypothetical protein